MIINMNMNLRKKEASMSFNQHRLQELSKKLLPPHHVIDHLPDGDLQSSQRLVGRQDVRQPREAQHAGHRKQHLRDQLRILLMPVVTHCETVPTSSKPAPRAF